MKFPDAHPVVLGTVMTAAGLKSLALKSIPSDAIEVRVDALLAEKVPVEKIETALRAKKHPVLLTLRIPPEGGQRAWKVKERRELFLQLLPLVEAIDVELATARARCGRRRGVHQRRQGFERHRAGGDPQPRSRAFE